jgi:hypothetical protein
MSTPLDLRVVASPGVQTDASMTLEDLTRMCVELNVSPALLDVAAVARIFEEVNVCDM